MHAWDPTTVRAILRVRVNKQVAWPAHTEKLLSRGPCLDKESELMCTRASRTWDKIMRADRSCHDAHASIAKHARLATHWPYVHRATHLAIAMHGDSCWARRSSPLTHLNTRPVLAPSGGGPHEPARHRRLTAIAVARTRHHWRGGRPRTRPLSRAPPKSE